MHIKKILVTGAAGFIGMHLFQKLIDNNYTVVGLDSMNHNTLPELAYNRLAHLGFAVKQVKYNTLITNNKNAQFVQLQLNDTENISALFQHHQFDAVIHLAAQTGVRYSLQNPHLYIESNVNGFLNILEGARNTQIKHLIFASSSSVYGLNAQTPFVETHSTDSPVSLYGATKKANEVMAYSYAHLFNIPTTALRFFTVYGPWGRPDMAVYLFTKAIFENTPINIFNSGNMFRDFTYIDDIVQGIFLLIHKPPTNPPTINTFNIGNEQPIPILYLIECLEKEIGKNALKNMQNMQAGDMLSTHAHTQQLFKYTGFKPNVSLEKGIKAFVEWYKLYYKL